MWINRTSIRILVLGVVITALGALAGCRRSSANEKRYELKGKVVAVEKDKRLVTIAHEEIKGYMPGMVMPFTIKDDWPFEIPLVPGDQITATLVIDGSTSWLENELTTVSRCLARVAATFSRRSPPSRSSGPHWYRIRPSGCLP